MPYFPTFAYCSPSQCWAVSHAAGVDPLTCPPYHYAPPPSPPPPPPSPQLLSAGGEGRGGGQLFDSALLRHRKLLYFSLHGIPGQPYWYGANHTTAMSTAAFHDLDLSDTIVFVANCHLPQTPFLQAILDCNPLYLVGGQGVNFTRGHSLVGAHLLGYLFRLALELRIPPAQALAMAKYTLTARTGALQEDAKRLKNRSAKRRLLDDITANQDALDFTAYTNNSDIAT